MLFRSPAKGLTKSRTEDISAMGTHTVALQPGEDGTVAMIAGMSPIALGLGADSSFRQPMAIAVIGGLLTSTALSLLIVPVVYTYIDDLEHWLGRMFRRGAPLQHAPAE